MTSATQRSPAAKAATAVAAGAGAALTSLLIREIRRRRARAAQRTQDRIRLSRQNSGVNLRDGSRELYLRRHTDGIDDNTLTKVVIWPIRKVVFDAHKRLFLDDDSNPGAKSLAASTTSRPGVNANFFRQFLALWVIMCPRIRSKITGLLVLQMSFLFARTYLSLLVARLDGALVRDLVKADLRGFITGLLYWFALAGPASYTNAMIRYLQGKISISFRTRLVRYIHDLYLNERIPYYRLQALDHSVEGIDQYITTDINRFCDAAARIYANIGKPLVDMVIFMRQLVNSLGAPAVAYLFACYGLSAYALRAVSPAFGRLAATGARLEGAFRNAHARLITHSEEVAFYHGAEREQNILDHAYAALARHIDTTLRVRIRYNMVEDYVIKYAWSAMGLVSCAGPLLLPASMLPSALQTSESDLTQAFITNKRLMLTLADAGGRLMYSHKDLAELAGYTSRVYLLLSALHRVYAQAYGPRGAPLSLADAKGTLQLGYEGVRLEAVPIVAPGPSPLESGTLLCRDIELAIASGDNVLITGANGVGKTAVARVLAGLWPAMRGLVSRPRDTDILFLSQRPYLSAGSLREQVTYPDEHYAMVARGFTDADLDRIFTTVRLAYLPTREAGWDTRAEWSDVLSGGEKQRVQLARLFYHAPKFAVLDEATSAVSADVEALVYAAARDSGTTLVTISHRPTLRKFHTWELAIGQGPDGRGWELRRIDAASTGDGPSSPAAHSLHEELTALQAAMAQRPALLARRQHVESLLNPGKKTLPVA